MIKACIFDLDGVLVDTAHYHFLAWKRLADELEIPFDAHNNERLKGVSRLDSLEIILSLGNRQMTSKEKLELADRKNRWFVEYVEAMKPEEVFPGVIPLLQTLRGMGQKIALASSSKNARRVIELTHLGHLFDAVVDGTMIGRTKPDPEIFIKAARALSVEPANCLVFEDAEAGVEAARNAGMRCIGIGSPVQLSKADLVLAHTGDFDVNYLRQL